MKYKNTKKNIIKLINLTFKHNQGNPYFNDDIQNAFNHIKSCLESEIYFNCVFNNALKRDEENE